MRMLLQELEEKCEEYNCGKIISAVIVTVVSVGIITLIGTILGMLFFSGCYETTGV